jgi:hypothetical protein
MAYAFEHQESPVYSDDGSLTRVWNVADCQDHNQAEALAFGANAPIYEGRIRKGQGNVSRTGYSTFRVEIKHEPPPPDPNDPSQQPPNNDPPGGILEFDAAGTTQHITTAVVNQWHYPNNAPNMKGAIGVGKDTVEGTDIIIPTLQFTITKHFPIAQVSGTYVKNLARMTGRTNQLDYNLAGEDFEAGELLFLGASGSCRGRLDWEISYRFSASENIENYKIPGTSITVASKKGHDYLWIRFKQEESQDNLVQVPEFAYVARVYKDADFKTILGF